MNVRNPIVFSRGIQMSNINGKINKEEYRAIFDGKIGKAIVKKNDGKIYYIEANPDELFKQQKSDESINNQLENLVKLKTRNNKKKKRRGKKKRNHYTVRRKKTPLKTKSRRRKTLLKIKSRRKKTPSKKRSRKATDKEISNDPLTLNNIMKTIT